MEESKPVENLSENNPQQKSEESRISLPDLLKEITELKSQVKSLKEEVAILKVDKQMKDFKISFFEQKMSLQDSQISSLKQKLLSLQTQKQPNMPEPEKNINNLPELKDNNKKENNQIIENNPPKEENSNIQYKNKSKENPNNLTFVKDLAKNAPNYAVVNQMFTVFKTLSPLISPSMNLLIYPTKKKTLEFFDLEKEELVKSIPSAHSNDIYACRYFYDKKNFRDLLITSSYDKSIKVWDLFNIFYNSQNEKAWVTVSITDSHKNGFIYSPYILSHEKLSENFIISGADEDCIKLWDFNGKFLNKEVLFDNYLNYIETFYDPNLKNFYVIVANGDNIKSFNFDDFSLYKTYQGKKASSHLHVTIRENKENNFWEIIESDFEGFIKIWNFHTAECLEIIPVNFNLNGNCLWNKQFLITTGGDKEIKIVNFKDKKVEGVIRGHLKSVNSVKKIWIEKYGDCLISHAKDGTIKLWA